MKKKEKTISYSVSKEGNVSKVKNVMKNGKLVKNVTKTYGDTDKRKTVERSRLVGKKAISYGKTSFVDPDGKTTKLKSFAVNSPSKSVSIGVKKTNDSKESFVKKTNNKTNSSLLRTRSGSDKPVYKVSGTSDKTSIKNTLNPKYARQMYKADEYANAKKK